MTGFLAASVLLIVGIVSFVVARTTARAEVAAVISAANPIMPAAPAFMPRNAEGMVSAPVVHAGACTSYFVCLNSKLTGQCDGCKICMKTCGYPYSTRCYREFSASCV